MKKAFSLIELLVVIAITAVLLSVAVPNYLGARERARDAKKKQELDQMKNALRLYYNDFQKYPAAASGGIGKLNYVAGCGPLPTPAMCPCTSTDVSADFAVGTSCQTLYMKKFPSDLGSSMFYYSASPYDDFCLKVPLENAGDGDIALSQTRCSAACGTNCSGLDYCVCAD